MKDTTMNDMLRMSNRTLVELYQKGDSRAADALCLKNEALIMRYAKGYLHLLGNRLDLEDLMQYGRIGLIRAAERFRLDTGFAFSTYAVHWIRQQISRGMAEDGFTVRFPVHFLETYKQLRRRYEELSLSDIPAEKRIELLATELKLSPKKVRESLILGDRYLSPVSLEYMVGEDADTCIGDLLSDEGQPLPELLLERAECGETLSELLNVLPERVALVLRLRYGFDCEKPHTLDEIGGILQLTRERIRQLELSGLRSLRAPAYAEVLEDCREVYLAAS